MAAEGLAVKGWQGPGWLDGRRDEECNYVTFLCSVNTDALLI